MRKIAAAVLLSAMMASPARAQQDTAAVAEAGLVLALASATFLALADLLGRDGMEGKYYVAGDAGTVSYRNAFGSNGASPFPGAPAYRAAGGFTVRNRYDPEAVYFSGELSYTSLENSVIEYGAAGRDTLHGSSVQAALILAYPVWRQLELTGKIGFINTKTSMLTSVAGRRNADGSNSGAVYGLGIQYRFHPRYFVRMQYDVFGKIDRTANPARASALTAGVGYVF